MWIGDGCGVPATRLGGHTHDTQAIMHTAIQIGYSIMYIDVQLP